MTAILAAPMAAAAARVTCERCGHELARDPGAWGFWVSAPGEPRAGSDRGLCPDTDRRHVPGVAR